MIIYFGIASWATYMRNYVEREGGLLVRFLSDWANIHKTARTLSRVRGGCITVRFTVKSAAATGELLENNYAKKTQSREPTNILKYMKNLNMRFNVLFILYLNTKSLKNSNITYQFSAGTSQTAQWLRCCATNRKVAGSIPDGVIGIFH